MKKTIYVDLDGVLCDFDKGIVKVVKESVENKSLMASLNKDEHDIMKIKFILDKKKEEGVREVLKNDVFKNLMRKLIFNDPTWWESLHWLPEGKKLWNFLIELNPKPIILTSSFKGTDSVPGKTKWVKENLGEEIELEIIDDKETLADQNSILIDDRQQIVDKFAKAGGKYILHVTADKTINEVKEFLGINESAKIITTKMDKFLNEGLEFLMRGKNSGKVLSFSDFVNESDKPKIPVNVTYENGEVVPTEVDGDMTDEEIREYFKPGKEFNIGVGNKDNFQKVKSIEILKPGEEDDEVESGKSGAPNKVADTVEEVPSEEEETKPITKKAAAGYGDLPFYFSKNGDLCLYFFKLSSKAFVLTVGKFSKFTQPTEQKTDYSVLSMTELKPDELDQAVLDHGKYKQNTNAITLDESSINKLLNHVAICIEDYVQKNPQVTKFYDEIQATVKFKDYDNKFMLSLTKWPGGTDSWKMQSVEKSKFNVIIK